MTADEYKVYNIYVNLLKTSAKQLLVECGEAMLELERYQGLRPDLEGNTGKVQRFSFVKLEDGQLEFNWEDTWRYGGYECHVLLFPIGALWDENYRAELKAKAEAARIKYEYGLIEGTHRQKALVKSANRAFYNKLKQEYEG
jgi:hypothetical protein